MDPELARSLHAYLADRSDRPFGDVESISGRLLQPFSTAGHLGATNLLDKARRQLDRGDLAGARGFVDRAVGLPYDNDEEAAPAAIAAHMEFFCLVTDTLEEAEPGDSRWLDAAIDVLASADDAARCDLRDVLRVIDHDYSLSSRESSRVRAAISDIPERAELRDLDLDSTDLGDQVMSVLIACKDYVTALQVRSS